MKRNLIFVVGSFLVRNLVFVVGLFFLLVYLNAAFDLVRLPPRLALLLSFGIGPAVILVVFELSDRLRTVFPHRAILLGSVFLIIAFALFTLMLTMQNAIFAEYRQLRAGRPALETPEALRQAFALVNHIQLGADVAFDVFYCLGIMITSLGLLGRTGFPRLAGAYGLLIGSALLLLNMWTFPTPPAEAGAVDLGPATGVWWLSLLWVALSVEKANPLPNRPSAE